MTNGQTSRKLNLFDVTNLVVGGTVGADIYIVASLGSAYLGPASLLVWLVAGAIAIILICLCSLSRSSWAACLKDVDLRRAVWNEGAAHVSSRISFVIGK
ncbi:MAG: hypothetical protein ACXW1N_08495 [Halobacteriota archaeon]